MSDIEDLPNIGPELGRRLRRVGIATDADLRRLGDAQAFGLIRAELPEDACTHTRLALAGAIRGVRWHALDKALRARLAEEAHAR